MLTVEQITDASTRNALLRAANASNAKVKRATRGINGQIMRVRGGGKRVAEVWANRVNALGQPGAVGMAVHAHVCRNLKTARLKPPPVQKWKPDAAPEAYAIEPYETKSGKIRYREREMGTGAYDPRVKRGKGTRRVANTRTVVIGGYDVEVPA